jgi:hypothetical protein
MKNRGCRALLIFGLLSLGVIFLLINQIQLSTSKEKIEKGTEFSGSIKKIHYCPTKVF